MIGWKIYCGGALHPPGGRGGTQGGAVERDSLFAVSLSSSWLSYSFASTGFFWTSSPVTSVATHWPSKATNKVTARLNPKPNDELKIVTKGQFRTLAMFYPETSF